MGGHPGEVQGEIAPLDPAAAPMSVKLTL
jgi:hypothetical protein